MGPARRSLVEVATPAGLGIRSSPEMSSHRQESSPPNTGALSSHKECELCARRPTHGEQILPALSVTLGKIHILKKIPVSRRKPHHARSLPDTLLHENVVASAAKGQFHGRTSKQQRRHLLE